MLSGSMNVFSYDIVAIDIVANYFFFFVTKNHYVYILVTFFLYI